MHRFRSHRSYLTLASAAALLVPTINLSHSSSQATASAAVLTPTTVAITPAATPTTAVIISPTTPPTATPRATRTPTPRPTRTPTPRPTPTKRPTATPTPNPHPGFGAVPWLPGEYYIWTVRGRNISGTAWQLTVRAGHEWIEYTALQQTFNGVPSTFTSRLAFNVNTYRLRRYDAVQDNPATVLRATLIGPHLDYTSYQSWGRAGCVTFKRIAPVTTTAFGQMSDLVRATDLHNGQHTGYPVFDPYATPFVKAGYYNVIGREMLSTVIGKIAAIHVRFVEPSQPALDVWYSAAPQHVILKWGTPGVFEANLSHYEGHGKRLALPIAPVTVKLTGKNAACQ